VSLRLTFDNEDTGGYKSFITPQSISNNSIIETLENQQPENKKVFLYGVLTGDQATFQNSSLVAYSRTEGYEIENREIDQLGNDLKESPIAVVINPMFVPFINLLLALSILTPVFQNKTLFILTISGASDSSRAFWRSFGVLDVINLPVNPFDLFSLIKVFQKITGNIEAQVDFSLSVDSPYRVGFRGGETDFILTIKETKNSGFIVKLSLITSSIGDNVAFFPRESVPPFNSICRIRVPSDQPSGVWTLIVRGEAGKVIRDLKLTIII
jgi:hypothetical protein